MVRSGDARSCRIRESVDPDRRSSCIVEGVVPRVTDGGDTPDQLGERAATPALPGSVQNARRLLWARRRIGGRLPAAAAGSPESPESNAATGTDVAGIVGRLGIVIAVGLWASGASGETPESPAAAPAEAAGTIDSAPAAGPVITLEPSDDPDPPPVVIGTPRPDGSGRVPGEMVEFALVDQLGRAVTRETLLGRPWVANFIFANCPTHCPATLNKLYDLQLRIRETDVRLVTITVDPATDTVPRMLQLSKAFGADPERWLFLTGEIAEIHRVIVDGFQQPMVANPMALAHSLNLMHVDASGRVLGKYRFHYLEGESELNTLRRVLLGEIETPEENRFVPKSLAEQAHGSSTAAGGEPVEGGLAASDRDRSDVADSGAARSSPADRGDVPPWVERLRGTNAMLNGLATLLLLAGLGAAKRRRFGLHKQLMLTAFGVSIAFLACYLTYHGALRHFTGIGHKPYTGPESLTGLYRLILWTHVPLAALVPPLALATIWRGFREQWDAHRRLARITFPTWLYVSVTGVVIYFMNAG